MLAYRDGDTEAFSTLYERHRGPLYRTIRRQCGSASVADELFQDVWMNLIQSRGRYRVEAKFTTFLYRIAHNRVIDHRRSRSSRLRVIVSAENPGEAPEPMARESEQPDRKLAHRQRASRLHRELAALPDEQREAFLLREEGGLTVEEIAHTVGVGKETAKSRLRYAVVRLRRALEEI